MFYTLRAPYMLVHYHHHFILREVSSVCNSYWCKTKFLARKFYYVLSPLTIYFSPLSFPLIVSHQGSNPILFTNPFHLLLRTAYTLYPNMFCFTVFTFLVFVFYWLLAIRLSWFPVRFWAYVNIAQRLVSCTVVFKQVTHSKLVTVAQSLLT